MALSPAEQIGPDTVMAITAFDLLELPSTCGDRIIASITICDERREAAAALRPSHQAVIAIAAIKLVKRSSNADQCIIACAASYFIRIIVANQQVILVCTDEIFNIDQRVIADSTGGLSAIGTAKVNRNAGACLLYTSDAADE